VEKLETIQTHHNLNEIYSVDEAGAGGAHHVYVVCKAGSATITEEGALKVPGDDVIATIQFQHGARKDPESIPGVLGCDLLEIVRDQLKAFQAGPFRCEENAGALEHIEKALMYMNMRVENRASRGVLGTMNK